MGATWASAAASPGVSNGDTKRLLHASIACDSKLKGSATSRGPGGVPLLDQEWMVNLGNTNSRLVNPSMTSQDLKHHGIARISSSSPVRPREDPNPPSIGPLGAM